MPWALALMDVIEQSFCPEKYHMMVRRGGLIFFGLENWKTLFLSKILLFEMFCATICDNF